MGGTKRKIPMEKIEKKEARSVAFSKRREGLYRKASELCLLCDAHIAILVTPPSAKSLVSFYSFGHSSVDDVVDAFLLNRTPALSHDHALKNTHRFASQKPSPGLGFHWEEDGFEETDNTRDLEAAIDEISELMNNVRLRLHHMNNQSPRLPGKTPGESSVQGLDSDRGNLVGNLAPQVSDQTKRISEDSNMVNSGIRFEQLGQGTHIEAGSLYETDPVDGIDFDDFFVGLSF